jgi:Ca-activated chloride channel family protein
MSRHERSSVLPRSWLLLLCASLALLTGTSHTAACQDISDVHVIPRPLSHSSVAQSVLPRPYPLFKAGVDLVLVPVTVTDPMDRIVTGLDKNNFTLYQDKQKESIEKVSREDAPISVGVILDVSGSMRDKIDKACDAIRQFLETSNPQDEFFLVTFADQPQQLSSFTHRIDDLENRLLFVRPGGRTSLLDAIYLATSQMRDAINPRKALLVISDGGDNHSRYTESEVKSVVEESDVQVFSIGIFDEFPSTPEERSGPELLDEITGATGGRTFTVDNPNDLPDVAAKIGLALRDEYVIAYQPTPKIHDGKWHKIKVKLHLPRGMPPLHVDARSGYYASSE